MLAGLAENWWVVLLQGILSLLFGVLALSYPGLTLALLLMFFAAYCLVDGLTSIFASFKAEKWLWYLLGGLVSVAAGVVTFARPQVTAIALVIFIGWWAMIHGVTEVVAALKLRREIEGELWLILSGLISILFGLYVIFRPGAGALALIWVIAFFALVKGMILILLSVKLKGLKGAAENLAAA